jgi:AcrR family transcriptional regulator
MLHERDKPQQMRSKKRVEATLQAAKKVLAESGYASMTLQAVCQEADVKPTSIYRYWPNQAALLTSLLEVFEEEMAALILGHAENGDSSDWRLSLRQLIGDITDYCETNLWVYAGRTALSDNSVFMQMHKQTFALFAQHISRLFDAMGMVDDAKKLHAAQTYTLIMDAYMGAVSRDSGNREAIRQIQDTFMEVICAFLAPYFEATSS